MSPEQIAELRQWCADSDNGKGDGADADREGVMLDTPVLKQLLDERAVLLEALRGLLKWPGYTDSRLEANLALRKAESP